MQELEMDYKERLQAVAEVIQGSDELAAYLEEETPELYKALQETYEPWLQKFTKRLRTITHYKFLNWKKFCSIHFLKVCFTQDFGL